MAQTLDENSEFWNILAVFPCVKTRINEKGSFWNATAAWQQGCNELIYKHATEQLFFLFFYLGFLSQPFTNHGIAKEEEGHFF